MQSIKQQIIDGMEMRHSEVISDGEKMVGIWLFISDKAQKLIMAKACINSAGSYGLEASGAIDQHMLKMIEKVQRRFARLLLGAGKCTANKTTTLELNLPLIDIR